MIFSETNDLIKIDILIILYYTLVCLTHPWPLPGGATIRLT